MKKQLVRITLKEAKQLGYKDVQFKLTNNGLEYYRPKQRIYVLRYWINDNEYEQLEFNNLKDAEIYAKQNYKNYDIMEYKDKTDRFWCKQYQYINNELIGVDEQ